MFYYPNVLQRHSGCFSTIWLAATRGTKVTRRDLLKVQVSRTCRDIMDYVTGQVPHMPRLRFSLYLSSQLQYGVVLVFHRQCGFLLEEIQQTIDGLLRAKTFKHIDMAASYRHVLDVPDSMYMMKEAEGAQDPFFGLMELHQLPSPYKIHQEAIMIKEVGSQHSLVPSPNTTLVKEGFGSPPAAITLTEKEYFIITNDEHFEGDELPEATSREIDLLMDQPDQFCREVEVEVQTEDKDRECEGLKSQLKETVLGAEQDSVWLLDEESGQPVGGPLVDLEMTPLQINMPTTESSYDKQVVVPPLRKPVGVCRRQLVFADLQVQISNRTMKDQIGNMFAETRDLVEVLLPIPALTSRPTPAQLFSTSCGSLLHADLQSLWKQCAFLTALPEYGEGQRGKDEEEEIQEESEQDRDILRKERRHSSMKEIASESGLQPADGSSALDAVRDMSNKDKSVNDVITPVGRWAPQEEVQAPIEPITEENTEMPEAQIESRDMLRWVRSYLEQSGEVSFESLLPLEADRFTAAHSLYNLLALLSEGQVKAYQSEPYSCITINSG